MRLLTVILLCFMQVAIAGKSVHLSLGRGNPNRLRGWRVSARKDWQWQLLSKSSNFVLKGAWDLSYAYWHTDISMPAEPRNIYALAIAPVLHLQPTKPFFNHLSPYLEASVGGSILSRRLLAHRDLGSQLLFQDLLGFGIRFGSQLQYDLSWHYLHYSNANIAPPNNGIDVKILATLAYHFA